MSLITSPPSFVLSRPPGHPPWPASSNSFCRRSRSCSAFSARTFHASCETSSRSTALTASLSAPTSLIASSPILRGCSAVSTSAPRYRTSRPRSPPTAAPRSCRHGQPGRPCRTLRCGCEWIKHRTLPRCSQPRAQSRAASSSRRHLRAMPHRALSPCPTTCRHPVHYAYVTNRVALQRGLRIVTLFQPVQQMRERLQESRPRVPRQVHQNLLAPVWPAVEVWQVKLDTRDELAGQPVAASLARNGIGYT